MSDKYQLIDAEHIHCGDEFEFHEQRYVALGQFTDKRHTQTVIFAQATEGTFAFAPLEEVQPLRLFRTFPLKVFARDRYKLKPVLENTEEEVLNCSAPRRLGDDNAYCQLSF